MEVYDEVLGIALEQMRFQRMQASDCRTILNKWFDLDVSFNWVVENVTSEGVVA